MHQRDAGVEHAGHARVQDAAVVARIVDAAGGGRPGHPAQRQAAADVDATQVGDRVEATRAIACGVKPGYRGAEHVDDLHIGGHPEPAAAEVDALDHRHRGERRIDATPAARREHDPAVVGIGGRARAEEGVPALDRGLQRLRRHPDRGGQLVEGGGSHGGLGHLPDQPGLLPGHHVVDDVPGPATGLSVQPLHPLLVGTRFVVEALAGRIHGDGVLHHRRGDDHQWGHERHVDQVAADGLTHQVPVAAAGVHTEVRRAGDEAGLVAQPQARVGLIPARCQHHAAAGGERDLAAIGPMREDPGHPSFLHDEPVGDRPVGDRDVVPLEVGDEGPAEHPRVFDRRHPVDGVLSRTRDEAAEPHPPLGEDAVGPRALPREQSDQRLIPLDAELVAGGIDHGASVVHEHLDVVDDALLTLHIGVDEGEVAGRPDSIAADVLHRLDCRDLGARRSRGRHRSHACRTGAEDNDISLDTAHGFSHPAAFHRESLTLHRTRDAASRP